MNFTVYSCSDFRRKLNDEKYVQAQMMEYLEERYHEKFVMKSYANRLGTWYGNYIGMWVCPEGKDDGEHLFEVTGKPDDDWNLYYYDTRVDLRIEEELKEYFQPYVEKYYDDYSSYGALLYSSSYGLTLPADLTLEELFAQKYEAWLDLSFYVRQKDVDDNFKNWNSWQKSCRIISSGERYMFLCLRRTTITGNGSMSIVFLMKKIEMKKHY